jgi:actin-related protein
MWLRIVGNIAGFVNTLTGTTNPFDLRPVEEQVKIVQDTIAGLEKELSGIPTADIGVRRKFIEAELKRLRASLEGIKSPAADASERMSGEAQRVRPPERATGTTKEAKEAVDKEAEAYERLQKSIAEQIGLRAEEIQAGEQLTEFEKFRLKVMQEIATFEDQDRAASVRRMLDELALQDKQVAALRETKKATEEKNKAVQANSDLVAKQFADAEKLVAQYEDERAALELSGAALDAYRIKRQLANIGIQEGTRQYQEYLDKLTTDAEVLRTLNRQKELFDNIDKAANQAFIDVFEGSQDMMSRLKNTLESGLLQLLYDLTIHEWLINIRADLKSTSGESISLGSLISLIGGMFGGGSVAGNAAFMGPSQDPYGGFPAASSSSWTMPDTGGGGSNAGMVFVQNNYVDARSDRADVYATIAKATSQSKVDIYESTRRGGTFANLR